MVFVDVKHHERKKKGAQDGHTSTFTQLLTSDGKTDENTVSQLQTKGIDQSNLPVDVRALGLCRVQELCESRGGRPVLSVLTSIKVSVDVKIY